MSSIREQIQAELRQLLNEKGGADRIRELYEEITGENHSGLTVYIGSLIPTIVDRQVQDTESAMPLSNFFPDAEGIVKLSAQDVGERLLFYFEDLTLKKQHRNAIKRDYIGGRYPVQSFPEELQASISKVLLEGWDWLVSQGLIVQENKRDSCVLSRRGEEYLKSVKERQGKFVIFYSWQSDLPRSRNCDFIQECIEEAISSVSVDGIQLIPCLDRDTQDEPGAPDIAETILRKIENSDMVVCDVSIITGEDAPKACPNPNVMLELGYAAKHLGWERVTNVVNLCYGKIENLPFDLRKRRVVKYSLQPEQSKSAAKKSLVESLKLQIEACIKMGKATLRSLS